MMRETFLKKKYSIIDSSITKMVSPLSSLLVLVVLELLRRANAGASIIRSSSRIYDVSIDG